MKSFVISDTHFGHKGSLMWPGGVRKFASVKEADAYMVEKWNSIVSDNDIVYHLGDFAFKCSMNYAKNIFRQLNGAKILIKGNHDHKLASRFDGCWLDVHDRLVIEIERCLIVMDHYPLYSWYKKFRGSIHIHGHTHENNPPIGGRIFNASVENIGYGPKEIIEIINELK